MWEGWTRLFRVSGDEMVIDYVVPAKAFEGTIYNFDLTKWLKENLPPNTWLYEHPRPNSDANIRFTTEAHKVLFMLRWHEEITREAADPTDTRDEFL